ncbi:MAG TPA: cation:proton antiporter [Blastocatellia bacterium]|nr:cation:proton antiporter [Blastocatellia bacterium]
MPLLAATGDSSHAMLFLTLFVMYVAAKLAAELFERLNQPAVIGEILAGVIIGPSVLGLVVPSERTGALSEMGVVFYSFLSAWRQSLRKFLGSARVRRWSRFWEWSCRLRPAGS